MARADAACGHGVRGGACARFRAAAWRVGLSTLGVDAVAPARRLRTTRADTPPVRVLLAKGGDVLWEAEAHTLYLSGESWSSSSAAAAASGQAIQLQALPTVSHLICVFKSM